MEINRKNLRNIIAEPYREDMEKYKKALKPFIENKFTELRKAATEGKSVVTIYSVWKDIKPCCYCPNLYWKLFSEKKLDFENYGSLKYHYPSLQLEHFFQAAEKVVKEINKENNYDFFINSGLAKVGFWIDISW